MFHLCFDVLLFKSHFAQEEEEEEEEVLSNSQSPFERKPRPSPYHRWLLYLSASALVTGTMHVLQLLPLASLALAVSNPNSITKRQSSCTSESWAIQQYHTCTNCTCPGSTQETTSLVFDFADPNFNPAVTATCELSLLPGSSLIDFNYTPCGSGVAFYYDGTDLNVERTGVECGK